MSRPDVWLTPDELAREYRFPSVEAARKWARRKNLARGKLRGLDGRKICYARAEVEQARTRRGPLVTMVDTRKAG